MSRPSIVVDSIATDGTNLECEIRASPDVRRFFTGEPFRASYDVDVSDVPDGVLVVPVLAHVLPVAWANGADVYVDEIDATFARAVEDVKATLLSMHDFLEGGRLYADRTVDATVDPSSGADESATVEAGEATAADGTGLLFTGGVDSTCSYVRHREDDPTLISVRGWTITDDPSDDEKWDDLRSRVTAFADEHGHEASFVESNMLSFLDHPMLLAHYKRHVAGGWYSSVGSGIGLLGLCAPLTSARGIDDLVVAATGWEGIDLEWGSHPDIDDYVRWGETRCHHDGYELTRQERLDVIADYIREDASDLALQTCNYRMDGNCSDCEKCYRTILGLRLAGLDPNDHGYRFDDGDYRDVRRSFEDGEWVLGEDQRYMWEDIRERAIDADPRSAEERAFFGWIEDADFDELVDESGPPLTHTILRAGARNAPTPLYTRLYPAYVRAKSTLERRVGSR